ncbi:hypothetical protein AMTRI_Chr12g239330 [Amborella trichopoda]
MLPQSTMVLDDTILVGKMIEHMGMDDVPLSAVMRIVTISDPLSPAKSQICVKNSKKLELGTCSSEKKKKKVESSTRSSAWLQGRGIIKVVPAATAIRFHDPALVEVESSSSNDEGSAVL